VRKKKKNPMRGDGFDSKKKGRSESKKNYKLATVKYRRVEKEKPKKFTYTEKEMKGRKRIRPMKVKKGERGKKE